MSDRRLQSSRDDRRRDRDGDRRDGDRREGDRREGDRREGDRRDYGRRRSRSPPPRRDRDGRERNGHDVDRYQSSRDYREREREDRYGGRDRREWRRDPRRDEGDRRRDQRRGPDLFDDRRRGPPRDDRDRRDVDRDRARDRDDMRQMETQATRRSPSPSSRRGKEPTPDLTEVVPVLERKRRMTQWDIKPPGYENVTAEQAKLSGMFPLPGAPRAQPMDPSKLKAFMDQPGGSASGTALKPSTARQSKRLFVHGLPQSASDETVMEFFNTQLNGLNVTKGHDPCVSAKVSQNHSYALLEFKTTEDATNAMALDGIGMEPEAMATGDGEANGGTAPGLAIKRPKDYIVPAVSDDTAPEGEGFSNTVPDTANKISITRIPTFLADDQVQELLQSFGQLKNFVLVKDTASEQSRGIAFCEYVDSSNTEIAIEGLNEMDELGGSKLKAQKASIGIQQVSAEMSVNAMSLMAGTTRKDADQSRVLCLMNMITREELLDPDEADEVLEDVKEECAKYGTLLEVKMPRPSGGLKQANGVGKIYIKYAAPESAQKALSALAGRKFADRTVVVTVFEEEYFDVGAW